MEAIFKFMIASLLLVFLANLNVPKGKNPVHNVDKRMRKESEKAQRRNPDSSPSFLYYVVLFLIGSLVVSYFFGPDKN